MIRTRRPTIVLFTVLLFAVPTIAKDQWVQVKSQNFFLIGNASEKDIRNVAARLEQFRETFRLVFSGMNLKSSTPTNVIVFKSDSSYKQFKPKRGDGKTDNFIAGYFQPGEDVNYITLSTEGEDKDTFSTIFHEYVHSIVNTNFGRSGVPAWFNEGLAEYFSTFVVEDDIKAKLGLPLDRHLYLLSQSKFMPLETLLALSNSQMSNSGDHSRSIFYAESWVLVHYLLRTGKLESLGNFLDLVLKNTPQQTAFQTAFQTTYAAMEAELRKYVTKNTYMYQEVTFKKKLVTGTDMTAAPLNEASMNTYLGDLLAHTQRDDDAEPFLKAALQLEPGSSMANTTLGMVKMRQRKFDEAKKFLEVAITDDISNAQAYYNYAYLLSREGQDEFGISKPLSKETADKMRAALKKAIALKPGYTASYDLLAYLSVATNEGLEDAASVMQAALKVQPGNQGYALRLAEIYSKLGKFADAKTAIERVLKTTDDPELRDRAQQMATYLAQREEFERRQTELEKSGSVAYGDVPTPGQPTLRRRTDKPLSAPELAKAKSEATVRSINGLLRKPEDGEQRIIGHISKVECKKGITYLIKTPAETFTVTSADFQALVLNVFTPDADNIAVACDADLSPFSAVLTYKPLSATKGTARGELTAIEFVTPDFRILTDAEMKQPAPLIVDVDMVDEKGIAKDPLPTDADLDKMRRDAILNGMRSALREPGEGEKRELGYLDKIECTGKGEFFLMRTSASTLRLVNLSKGSLPIKVFTPDLAGISFGCAVKPIEYPVVFVYKDAPDPKLKTQGEIVSLEFVPKSFTLN